MKDASFHSEKFMEIARVALNMRPEFSTIMGLEQLLASYPLGACGSFSSCGPVAPNLCNRFFAALEANDWDTRHALEEAGELRRAVEAGALPESKRATFGGIITGATRVPAEGLVTFTSVGMLVRPVPVNACDVKGLDIACLVFANPALNVRLRSDEHAVARFENDLSQTFIC